MPGPAGARRTLVIFERATSSRNSFNEEKPAWAEHGRARAQVYFGQGSERREAAQERGRQSATFRMLANATTRGVKMTDRLSALGSAWDIVSLAPDQPTPGEIEITATREAQ